MDDVGVKIKLSSDITGGMQTEEELRRLRALGKKLDAEDQGWFARASAGFARVTSAAGAFRKAIGGLAVGTFATAIIGGISKIVDSLDEANKQAEDFKTILNDLNESKAIAKLVNDYNSLKDAIKAANDEQNHQLDMIDLEVKNRRKLEDAKLDAAKEDEIGKLDKNAEDYSEQLDKIEKKYAAIKAANAASNAMEDFVLGRQKLNVQADQADEQADAQELATKAIDAKIAKAKRDRSAAEIESYSLNDSDKTGFWDSIGKSTKQLFSGDFGRLNKAKTAEGDQVRKEAAQRMAEKDKEIQQLEEERRKSVDQTAAYRSQGARLRERAEKMGGQIEALEIEGSTSRKVAARGVEKADDAIVKKNKETAQKKKAFTEAMTAQELLTREKADLENRISEQKERKAAAERTVYDAKGNLELAKAKKGDKKGQAEAYQSLIKSQQAADGVSREADAAIKAMTETLNAVKTKLTETTRAIVKYSSQQNSFMSELPSGE